jgi:triosephosphate isomerase (TIM)
MIRRPFVAGNWKMNLDLASARRLASEVRAALKGVPRIDIAVCPSFVYLYAVSEVISASPVRMGAQNCWSEPSGAFTGEVSFSMVKEAGCEYVILGHSERRHTIGPKDVAGKVIGESDEIIAAKCRSVVEAGMKPIVCVGETLAERDANQTEKVLTRQVHGSLAGVSIEQAKKLVIAYEPVWAIGTGRNATSEQAQAAHRHIRGQLGELFGPRVADEIRIQYGGSVKPDNAGSLMGCPDVDGALVGGASLKAADFLGIIDSCIKAKGLA